MSKSTVHRMVRSCGPDPFLVWLIVGMLGCQGLASADGEVEWDSITVTWDNDLFTRSNHDSYYTNGIHVRLESKPFQAFGPTNTPRLFLPLLDALPLASGEVDHHSYAIALGQKIFTPEDITVEEPQPDDLPYAGLLYVATDFTARSAQYADLFRLTLGVVGPWSLAEQTQKWVHDLVGTDEPMGWDYQLDNEIVFNGLYERRRRLSAGSIGERINYELVAIGRGELGTLNTGAQASLAVILTQRPSPGFGALQPAVATSNYLFRSELRQGWFGYLGVTGRLTLHNIFLDGNTFSDSPSVDKEPLNGALFLGVGFAAADWTASIAWDLESRRFKTQQSQARYGSLTFMYRF